MSITWQAQKMPLKSSATTTTTSINCISTYRRLLIFFILFISILLLFSSTAKLITLDTELYTHTLASNVISTITNDANSYPVWYESISESFKWSGRNPKIGLVNMAGEALQGLETLHADLISVNFDRVSSNVTWRDLYPLWIDEEQNNVISSCPDIPLPDVEKYRELDILIAKLPCGNWSQEQRVGIRDVFRLQVSLVVAKLAAESSSNKVYVVFISDGGCEPMLELFRCDDLVWHQGQYWVYKPDVLRLKQKVSLPVGACKVATQPHNFESDKPESARTLYARRQLQDSKTLTNTPRSKTRQKREAYVTVLHSSELYVCGAIALAQSILQTNTTKDLIILIDDTVTPRSIQGLKEAGWKIKHIEKIRCASSKKGHPNEWNCSKLRIWQLIEYTKIIFIDADFIVRRNIDHFFDYPQLSVAEDTMAIFNSGVMVVEPSRCLFDTLLAKNYVLQSYNGGDQGFLNEVFTWWHRSLPKKMSFLKCFMDQKGPRKLPNEENVSLIHFVGIKPWACYRDYDCNWDHASRHMFASDEVFKKWWEAYDVMPSSLKSYCGLTTSLAYNLKVGRDKAKYDPTFLDTHWKMDIKDPRQFNLID